MRSFRSELLQLVPSVSMPLAIAAVFPYRAIGFRAAERESAGRAENAFTTLDSEAEAAALRSARSSASAGRAEERGRRMQFPLGELPEDLEPARQPSLRAPAPVKAAQLPPLPSPPFPREEMLR